MCTKLLLWYEVLCVCVCWEGAWQFIMFITVIALILTHYTHTHTHTHTQDHTDTSFENVKLHEYRPPDEGEHALE